MTDKDKIRAEIERRRVMNFERKQGSRALEDMEMINFIDAMQEEPAPKIFEDMLNAKTPVESLGISAEEHDKIINLCLYGEKSVSEDLEAEIERINKNNHFDFSDWKAIARHFANWQKKQDKETIELAEDHAMLEGMEKMKEQMMKDAVDMVVGYWMPNGLMLATDESENCYNIDDGDKVKVIVIKED